jgi:hypothetical protein
MIALTIACLPCICVVGTCVFLSHAFYSLSTYELPSTKRKRRREYEERERRRRTPWVLTPRSEQDIEALSILGDEDVGDEEEGVEDDINEIRKARGQRTAWQNQSRFFALPLEIRRQIYEDAMGGYTLHVFTIDAYRRMSHTRCKTESPAPVSCSCSLVARQPGVPDEWGNSSLLSFVMSCRRV